MTAKELGEVPPGLKPRPMFASDPKRTFAAGRGRRSPLQNPEGAVCEIESLR
jgi:hypothetical protein